MNANTQFGERTSPKKIENMNAKYKVSEPDRTSPRKIENV